MQLKHILTLTLGTGPCSYGSTVLVAYKQYNKLQCSELTGAGAFHLLILHC